MYGGSKPPACRIAASLALAALASCSLSRRGPDARGVVAEDGAEWVSQAPEFLAVADRVRSGPSLNFGRGKLDEFSALHASFSGREGLRPGPGLKVRTDLAQEFLRMGDIDQALALMDEGIASLGQSDEEQRLFREMFRVRGLCRLRAAEIENCVRRHNRECCIFPLQEGGLHSVSEPAVLAKQDFLRYLALTPEAAGAEIASVEHHRWITVQWLLNITCMALDEYPQGVPQEYLVPPSLFESEHDIGRFVDIAPALSVDPFDHAGSVIVDDFDGDARLDIVTCSGDVYMPMHAYRNRGDGTFEDVSEAWHLSDQLGGLHMVGADYDNDGDLDILIPRGAWMLDAGCIRKSLLRNDGHGRFTDVTRAAGLGEVAAPSQTVAWADFDGDGWLDLYVGYESREEKEPDAPRWPSQLFRNNRDGTFTDVAREAGVTNDRFAKGASAADYDDDGDMDLYVSNLGANRLYRNDGDMRFTDVAPELGVTRPSNRSFACWFFDYDNDADMDLLVFAYEARTSDIALSFLGRPNHGEPPCLYRNDGGTFTDVAAEMGLAHTWLPMGTSFGDLDNDGWLDVYIGTGDPNYETLVPNVALRNDAGRGFQDVTWSGGLGHLQKGHGITFADLDDDGDQDIYAQLGGAFPGDAFKNSLFLNPGHGNHFVAIELVGTRTNRQAVGARLTVRIETPAGPRMLHRSIGSVSSFGNTPRRAEVGLADASAISSVEVFWPTSGLRQVITGVPLDASIRITEGRKGFRVLERHPVDLARAAGL